MKVSLYGASSMNNESALWKLHWCQFKWNLATDKCALSNATSIYINTVLYRLLHSVNYEIMKCDSRLLLQNPLSDDPSFREWLETHDNQTGAAAHENNFGAKLKRKWTLPVDRSKRIDVVSRYLFPLVFAVFNLAYWTTYLLQARAEFESLSKIGSS